MTTYSLTLRRDQLDALRAHLLRSDGAEHVAYVFCTMADIKVDPWDRQPHRKFLSVDEIRPGRSGCQVDTQSGDMVDDVFPFSAEEKRCSETVEPSSTGRPSSSPAGILGSG